MGKFQYKKRNQEAAKESAEGNDSKWYAWIKAGVPLWSPTKDVHRVRFCPPTYSDEPNAIGLRVTVHPNVGPDEKTHLCLKAMKQEPDPIEERLSDARRDGKADEKWAKSMKARDRVPTYLIDLDDIEKGVQLWPMADKTNSGLDRACIDRKTGSVIEIEHPEFGREVEIETKKERGRDGNDYTVYEFVVGRRGKFMSEYEDEQDEWLQYITDNPLDTVLKYLSYDELVEELGEVSHGRGERGGGERESRSARRGVRRSAPAAEPDSADEGDVGDAAWSEGDRGEPPAQSRRRRSEPDSEPAPESSRRRRRDEPDDEPAPESTRRRRREEPESDPEQDAPTRSRRRSEPEPEAEEPTRRRRRSETSDAPAESEAPTRRRRSEPEPEAEAPTRRRRSSEPAPEAAQDAERPGDLADEVGKDGLPDPGEPPASPGRRRRRSPD